MMNLHFRTICAGAFYGAVALEYVKCAFVAAGSEVSDAPATHLLLSATG